MIEKILNAIRDVINDYLLQKKMDKVKELLKSHIDSGEYTMYYISDASEKQNIMNMIRFYEIAFEDGYFENGHYYEASLWMSSNPEEVWEMYLKMKENKYDDLD